MPLSAVHCGASARIVRLLLTGPERRRILDLGFVPGTVIECAFTSPLGDPRAYRVRGSTTSLRRTQADQIVVEPCSRETATAEVESDDA
jgi:ferrous iron transport protein A